MSQSSQTNGTAGTAVAGPFTVRDLVVGAGVILLFLSSVLPLEVLRGIGVNLWNSAGLFQLALGILLPAVVLVLFVVRRLAPQTPLRIGSLSVDQFASVVAALALAFYFLTIVTIYSVSGIIGFIGALVLFAGTVCARWIPQLAADFVGRPETPAHPVARDAVPAAPKPKAPRPAAQRPGAPAEYGTDAASQPHTVSAGAAGAYGSATPAAAGWDQSSAQQPSTGQFAAPSGNGAAGVAGAAAAAQATQAPASATGASTHSTGRKTAASPAGVQQTTELEADDAVGPGAADGEAVGIPVTEESSGSSTTRAGALAAGGVARDVGYSAKTVVGSPQQSAEGERVPEPAGAGGAEAQDRGNGTAQNRIADRQAETAVPAGGPVGGAAVEPIEAGAGAAADEPTAARTGATRADAEPSAAGGATAAASPETATTAMPSVAANAGNRAAETASASSPISATREHYEEAEEEYEAFWFAVGRTRPVLDENTGKVMFTVEPGSWILALQDRGDEFLVQHTDGRVGVLRDLTNIERA
jgi:hypothetical protein